MNKRTKKLNLARETVVALVEVTPEQKAQVVGGACTNHSSIYTTTTYASGVC
ncbi:MAG TPA: hypothetical protein VGS22_17915 [Thermoanaerobaculia bacterium]|jgi:hypothetical protein|nr:hypothetical protein [Thermoanaerobaculia bacterium]